MWYLQSLTKASQRYTLVPGREIVVGRKGCDVLLSGDQSVSRRHATLCVGDESPGVVKLTDCKSKFGTSVNSVRMETAQTMALSQNDIISFGQCAPGTHSKFRELMYWTIGENSVSSSCINRLIYEPLVFCCSAMSKTDTQGVKQDAGTIGAEVVSGWSDRCSHLIMTGITVTVKVVCALSSCKPVVTPDWVRECVRCKQNSLALPSISSYQPPAVDPNLAKSGTDGSSLSFAPDYERVVLFENHIFYFFSEKQLTRLRPCLQPAGASLHLIQTPNSAPLDDLAKDGAVVLATDGDLVKQATPTVRKWIQQVQSHLENNDVRMVQDSEIGFALLYMSTDDYCNPRATPKIPPSQPPMAPPSLSQAPPGTSSSVSSSQVLPTQGHPLATSSSTHTLPFTQHQESSLAEEVPSFHSHHHHHHTTILAPDSMEQTTNPSQQQNKQQQQQQRQQLSLATKKRKGSCSVLRIDETLKSPLLDNSSVLVKTEEDSSEVNNEGGNSMSRGNINLSTDKSQMSSVISKSRCGGKDKEKVQRPSTSSPGTVNDRKLTEILKTMDGPKVKSEPLDLLFEDEEEEEMDEDPGPFVTATTKKAVVQGGGIEQTMMANEQGNPQEILKKSSIMRPSSGSQAHGKGSSQDSCLLPPPSSPSQPDGTILVPSTFPPRTQERGRKKPPLPDSQMLTAAFHSKRKKRPLQCVGEEKEEEKEEEEEEEKSQRKKKRVDGGSQGRGGGKGDGGGAGGGGGGGGEGRGGGEGKGGGGGRGGGRVAGENEGGGEEVVLSGLNGKRPATRIKSTSSKSPRQLSIASDKLPPILSGLPLLEACDTTESVRLLKTETVEDEQQTFDYQSELVKEEEEEEDLVKEEKEEEEEESIMEVDRRLSTKTKATPKPHPSNHEGPASSDSHPLPSTTQVTAPPTTPDPALFLSARKRQRRRRRSERETEESSMAATAAVSPHTQHTMLTQMTQRSRIFTPFTTLVTGGRRSKVTDPEHTNLWEEVSRNQIDGEDPLVGTTNEETTKKVYKPVCDENGFVCSRIKPRVQTSRAGRLAAFADSQLSNNSEAADGGGGGGGGTGGGGGPMAEIVFARLVVMATAVPGTRVKEEKEAVRTQSSVRHGTVKNFKKFKKVQHIGQGVIPRLVTLKEYIPPSCTELQEWITEFQTSGEGGGGGGGGGENERGEEDNLFQFTFSKTSSSRSSRR